MNKLEQDLTGMRIRLTKEHILNSGKGDSSECAIAAALLSVFPNSDYNVAVTGELAKLTYQKDDYEVTLYLSYAIQCWIQLYDEGKKVGAFTMIVQKRSFGYELEIANPTEREQELQGCIGELIELSNHMHLVNEGYAFRTDKYDEIMERYQDLYADTIYKFGTGEIYETLNPNAAEE